MNLVRRFGSTVLRRHITYQLYLKEFSVFKNSPRFYCDQKLSKISLPVTPNLALTYTCENNIYHNNANRTIIQQYFCCLGSVCNTRQVTFSF